MEVVKQVEAHQSHSAHARSTAEGIRSSFETKQVLATAYLFREIFAITGPLSRYLQSVNVDLGKALGLFDTALSRLQRLRSDPDKIIQITESDCETVDWKEKRVHRHRVMDGDIARDEPAQSERLEALLLMTTERKILMSLDKEQVITAFGGLTSELSKALI
jgi:hypothetical protein